jgi:hypothetical protein
MGFRGIYIRIEPQRTTNGGKMAKNRYTIELAQELDSKLDQLATRKDMTKAELIRRALALYALVDDNTTSDQELAIVNKDKEVKYLIPKP